MVGILKVNPKFRQQSSHLICPNCGKLSVFFPDSLQEMAIEMIFLYPKKDPIFLFSFLETNEFIINAVQSVASLSEKFRVKKLICSNQYLSKVINGASYG